MGMGIKQNSRVRNFLNSRKKALVNTGRLMNQIRGEIDSDWWGNSSVFCILDTFSLASVETLVKKLTKLVRKLIYEPSHLSKTLVSG